MVTSINYDSWTGMASVDVANVGDLDAGAFYTLSFFRGSGCLK